MLKEEQVRGRVGFLLRVVQEVVVVVVLLTFRPKENGCREKMSKLKRKREVKGNTENGI